MAAAPDDNPIIEFRDVTKRYGEVVAADRLNLAVCAGEFLSFLGPSGCGKTTSLRMIAGFEPPSEGEVLLDGELVNALPAYRRPVNMVFQHYALFPHLNVFGQHRLWPAPDRTPKRTGQAWRSPTRVGEMHSIWSSLSPAMTTSAACWELSGGQQQRVALARALINRPTVLLLDEPLAALDRKLRREMQIELQTLQRDVGSHFHPGHPRPRRGALDERPSSASCTRAASSRSAGRPSFMTDPINRYVADFVGKSNFFEGRITAGRDDRRRDRS